MFNMLCLQPAFGIYFFLMDSHHWHHCEIPDFYDPPRQKQSASKIFTFCFASCCMQPNIWTPPWAKCMSLTSKGRADTEAHQDDLATDRTSSKHLAPTLLQSLVLYLKRALPDRDGNVEGGCGDGKRHGSSLSRSQKDYF